MLTLLLALPSWSMSLEEAVDGAQATSPAVALAAAQVDEARAGLRQARAGLLPQATLTAGGVWQNEVELNILDEMSSAFPDFILEQIDPDSAEPIVVQPALQVALGASVTQPLVVPQVWEARKAAGEAVTLMEAEAEAQAQQITAYTVQAWFASAEAHALVEDAGRSVELAGRLVDKGHAMVEHGVASPDQVLPFEGALATAQATLEMAEEGAATTDRVLSELTGLSGGADPWVVPGEAPSLEASLARLDRPDLRAAAQRVQAAEAALSLARAERYPVVAATGSLMYLDPAPGLGEDWNYKLQLGASVPLFRGGAVQARIDAAAARVEQARAGEQALRQRARVEVQQAHGSLRTSLSALAEREEAVALARRSVEAAEKRLSGGAGSMLDLQRAQAELIQAEAQLTRARAGAARAEAELRVATSGGL